MAKRSKIRQFSNEDWKSNCIVAKDIITAPEFSQDDFDDVKQELCIGLYQESDKYRTRKSDWATFRWKILAQVAGKIKRERMQPSSTYMRTPNISLNEPLWSDALSRDDHPTLMDIVTNDHTLADGNESDGVERLGLIVDVRHFIDSLPPLYQRICNVLCHYNITDASKKLKIPKRTMARRIGEIRVRMIEAGLDEYILKRTIWGECISEKSPLI